MKKLLIYILTITCLLSCSRDYDYIDRGFDGTSSYTGAYTRAYLQQICDNLIIQNLQALETVLALYGDQLWTDGVEQKLDNELAISGVTVRKTSADSTWTLSRSGDYPINGINFPTSYTITAKMAPTNVVTPNHYNWNISLDGNRVEDEGYSCRFASEGTLDYKNASVSYKKWNSIIGKVLLFVDKDGVQIDKAMLQFKGDPFNPFYANLR